MQSNRIFAAAALLAFSLPALAQVPSQPQIKLDATTRVITVSAEETVSVEPDLAIIHIGFESKVADAKAAYADGSRISNTIVAALKQAGLSDSAIRSESQRLEPVDPKNHKFKLVQTWTVRTAPEHAAEILDTAITAGATDSGDIDWTVQDIGRYLQEHGLPYHPLWEKGYVSIGDWHTTRSLAEVDSMEDLRFFGLKRECGLHE